MRPGMRLPWEPMPTRCVSRSPSAIATGSKSAPTGLVRCKVWKRKAWSQSPIEKSHVFDRSIRVSDMRQCSSPRLLYSSRGDPA
eukprot:scaffold17685_cov63-Phaeocystis_antarctica.AAC.10